MDEQGLLSINYDTASKAVTLVYDGDAPYDIERIIAYVEDMTDGGSKHIMVFERTIMMHHMRKVGDKWGETA